MSETLISKAAAGVSYLAAGVARSAMRRHQLDERRRSKPSRQQRSRKQPVPDPSASATSEDLSCTADAKWRGTRRRISELKKIILICKKEREERSPVNQYSTSQRKRRMRNRLRCRIQETQELLRTFYDDLDTQPSLGSSRSRYLRFKISDAEKVIDSMQTALQALAPQTSSSEVSEVEQSIDFVQRRFQYLATCREDSDVVVKVEMSEL